jgi:hypothetical protein
MIVAIHPDAVKHVNVSNRQNYDKLKSYDVVRKYLLVDGLLASRGDLWRRQRKLMAPFYTPKGVQVYAELMLKGGLRLVDRWSGMDGKAVEIGVHGHLIDFRVCDSGPHGQSQKEPIVGARLPGERGRGSARERADCECWNEQQKPAHG